MKRWSAPRDFRMYIMLIAALALGGLSVFGAIRLAQLLRGPIEAWTVTLTSFGLLLGVIIGVAAAGWLLWRAWGSAALSYELDRNAICVIRPGNRYTIPLYAIQTVSIQGPLAQGVRIRFGSGRATTHVHIVTEQAQYQLAVREREAFFHELEERCKLGAIQPQPEGLTRAWPHLHAFWTATTVRRLLLLTLILNVAVWAVLMWRYPLLPDTIPVRFAPDGSTAGTRSKPYTLLLPGAATAMWLSNLIGAAVIYARARLASELLLLGACLVQIVLLVALWFIMTIVG